MGYMYINYKKCVCFMKEIYFILCRWLVNTQINFEKKGSAISSLYYKVILPYMVICIVLVMNKENKCVWLKSIFCQYITYFIRIEFKADKCR